MMYPRLKLAKNLLHSDGFIFVSIDSHEVSNLKIIMDDILERNVIEIQLPYAEALKMSKPSLKM